MSLFLVIARLLVGTAHAQGVDIVDQRIVVDLAHEPLHVEIDLDVAATDDSSSFALLTPFSTVTSLDVDGSAAELDPDPDYPDIASWLSWPDPLEPGDEAHVHMVLDGDPDCDPAFSQGAVCIQSADETVLFPSAPGAGWAFIDLFGGDGFTAEITVTAPEDHVVAAGQGAPTSVVDGDDGTRTWTFEADIPIENVAVWSRVADELRSADGTVAGWVTSTEENRVAMQPMVDLAATLWPMYEDMFAPMGLDEVHLLTFSQPTAFGGMGLLGNVLLHEFVLWDEYAYIREQGVAHELAHSWWGNRASGEYYEEAAFLNEGFAEYSGWRALGILQGDDVRTSGMRMNAVWYMFRRPGDEDIATLDPGATDSNVYVFVTYHKGSVVVRTLEEAAGPEVFAEALRAFVQRGVGGTSLDGLVEDVIDAGGPDLSEDVEQWLREPGYPTVVLETAETDQGVRISWRTSDPHRYRLPIRVERDDGQVVEDAVDVEPGEGSREIALASPAVRIEADPRWTLVRRVVPELDGDVTLDGRVDAADLMEVALRAGGELPFERRVDGHYDPLYDVDGDERIDRHDLDFIAALP